MRFLAKLKGLEANGLKSVITHFSCKNRFLYGKLKMRFLVKLEELEASGQKSVITHFVIQKSIFYMEN